MRSYYASDRVRALKAGGDAQIPALPTRRRLQALAALGYTTKAISELSGIRADHIGRIQNGHIQEVRVRRTAARAHRVFMSHGYTPAPVTQASIAVRNGAARKGWVAAAAWDDIDRDEYPAE